MAFQLPPELQKLAKNKKFVIGAALVGGAAGLYVLSKNGGLGGSAAAPNNTAADAAAAQAQQAAGGGGGTDQSAALADQLAQTQSQQSAFQKQITDAIGGLTDQFNKALAGVSSQDQASLNQLAGQVASQSGNAQQTDFSGFQSQFSQAIAALESQIQQQSAANTGLVQQYMNPSIPPLAPLAPAQGNGSNSGGGGIFGGLKFVQDAIRPIATPSPSYGSFDLGSLLKGLTLPKPVTYSGNGGLPGLGGLIAPPPKYTPPSPSFGGFFGGLGNLFPSPSLGSLKPYTPPAPIVNLGGFGGQLGSIFAPPKKAQPISSPGSGGGLGFGGFGGGGGLRGFG